MKLEIEAIPEDSLLLKFLYRTVLGRFFLKGLSSVTLSKAVGAFLDSPLSIPLIPLFVKSNNIDTNECKDACYRCFNDFFTRQLKDGARVFDMEPTHFVSPCDGLLSAYHIDKDMIIPVKQSRYSVSSLLRNPELAAKYDGGTALVFRLCVNHYHRYAYPVAGRKSYNKHIKGVLHTVRPIALKQRPVFTENSREYTLIKSKEFGTILQMEVGAMLVGKIQNYHRAAYVRRGQEKGRFLYGGSTIILLIQKDKVNFQRGLFAATEHGFEVPVKMGECLN